MKAKEPEFRIEVWKEKDWYWHAVAQRNGKIVADGSEGYKRKADCIRMAQKVTDGLWPVTVVEFKW
jgi:uncharacterized protein YegP (UPF0339 family)